MLFSSNTFLGFQKHYPWPKRVGPAYISKTSHATLEHANLLLASDREANTQEEPEPIQQKSMAKAMSPAMQQVHRLPAIASDCLPLHLQGHSQRYWLL